jgi:hypothetical protein
VRLSSYIPFLGKTKWETGHSQLPFRMLNNKLSYYYETLGLNLPTISKQKNLKLKAKYE